MNGLIGNLAVDVPQADIDCANHVSGYGAIHLPKLPPDRADVLRIAPHDDWFDELDEARREMVAAHARGAEKRIAADAFIRLDGYDPELTGASKGGADTRFPRLGRPVEQVDILLSLLPALMAILPTDSNTPGNMHSFSAMS